jgi:hypothetical protein
MDHPQGKTPIQTNNSTANGVVNGKIQPKQTKAMDMRFYWLKDRETQSFFQFHWKPVKNNLDDYWTKHHAAIHHSNIRSQILSRPSVITQLRDRLTKALKHAAARAQTYPNASFGHKDQGHTNGYFSTVSAIQISDLSQTDMQTQPIISS